MLRNYYVAKMSEISSQHRALVYARLIACLDPDVAQPFWLYGGWLRVHTCMTLALMILAAMHCRDAELLGGTDARAYADYCSAICATGELLGQDQTSWLAKLGSGLLHDLWQRIDVMTMTPPGVL